VTCGQKWLTHLTPFFTAREREHAGCQHRLFFSQVEFCDNLIFRRRAALDRLGERLLDANRTIGQPDKITVIFGRKITKHYRGKLQTEIEDMNLPNPVIRSHYGNGFIKQYVRGTNAHARETCGRLSWHPEGPSLLRACAYLSRANAAIANRGRSVMP
jgi:hypothetical protein